LVVEASVGNRITPDLVTDEKLNRILAEFTVLVQGSHVRKSVPGGSDGYRNVLIQLFQKRNGLKKGEIMEAWMGAGLSEPNGSTYQRVVKEFASHQGAAWMFKQGDGSEPI